MSGNGCASCAGKVLISGKNDLKSAYPHIASEWHWEKNFPLTPDQIFKASSKAVFWKCKKGHEWPAKVGNRTRQNSGCPYCGNKKVLTGYNDLQTINPTVALDWDYEENNSNPKQILYSSTKRVAWNCQICGHKWPARVVDRHKGSGCPKCKNEYHSSFPEQAIAYYLSQQFEILQNHKIGEMEIDVYLPEYKIAIEYDGKYYHGFERSHRREEEKRIFLNEAGIFLINVKEGDKDMIDGSIIWCHYHRSYNFIPILIRNLLIVIEGISEIHATVNVDLKNDYSKILSNYIAVQKDKSLAKVYPELTLLWDTDANGGLSPVQISYGSDRTYYWKCGKGHRWPERIANLVRGDRCPYCSGHKASADNNLLVTYPEIAGEWHPTKNGNLSPKDVTPRSNKEVYWICSVCGNEYEKSIDKRTSRNQGCRICGKKRMVATQTYDKIAKQGSLLDNYPEVAKLWHPVKNGEMGPENVLAGSHNEAWWICFNCGHEYPKEIRQKIKYPRCPKCKF